jgi:hypothetical protein
LTALQQPIFWRPGADPQTVLLVRAPHSGATAARFTPQSWPGQVIERANDLGRNFIVRTGEGEHRVWAPADLAIGDPITATITMLEHAPIQSEAALRFWRCITKGRGGAIRRLAPDLRTQRAKRSLRAIDARQDGASYRGLARVLFGSERVDIDDWKTCSLRDTTIRLVRCGLSLMKGDYLRLLRRTPIG